jgi:hypothetical protein
MKKVVLSLVLAGLMVGSANAAKIYLANSDDGSNGLTIPEGSTGNMDIRVTTAAVDSLQIAFINAFLDGGDENLSVTDVNGGQNWIYDRSAFDLPASLSGGNEYSLVSGDQDGGDALPLGTATHVIDTLTVLNSFGQSGDKKVTFELGARAPAAFSPLFISYITAPAGFPPGFPNFLYVGSDTSTNPAFIITKAVPEPATLGLLALGALVAIRRR